MPGQCEDNGRDRALGAYWERQFGIMAAANGKTFTPHQLAASKAASFFRNDGHGWNQHLLPDVTVWSAPGEHHEIKHKNPTTHSSYGLERYRLRALVDFAHETRQQVLYTIHDWQLAGARTSAEQTPNRLRDWRYADVLTLAEDWTTEAPGASWIGGQRHDDVWIVYWNVETFFRPLGELWVEAGIAS